MAFKQPPPPTQQFDVVGLEDGALDDVPEALMILYRSERKIEILDEPDELLNWAGLCELPEQPTRCTCVPLRGSFMSMLRPGLDGKDLWDVFAAHCAKITNLLDGNGDKVDTGDWWEGAEDKRKIKTEVYLENRIPYRLWADVARTVIHLGTSGQDTPFTTQPGMSGTSQEARESRRRANQILSYAHSRKSASQTPSSSSSPTTKPSDGSPGPTGEA